MQGKTAKKYTKKYIWNKNLKWNRLQKTHEIVKNGHANKKCQKIHVTLSWQKQMLENTYKVTL